MNQVQIAFSISEASSISGLCRTGLYEHLKTGALKAKKSGKRTLILKEDLDSFLSSLPSYNSSTEQ